MIGFSFFPGKTCSVRKLSLVTLTVANSCSISTPLPVWADSPCSPRNRVVGWSTWAGLQWQACARAAGSPQVSGCHEITFLPWYITCRLLFLLFFWLLIRFPDNKVHIFFVPITAQTKKDRVTSHKQSNNGWKTVIDYFPQENWLWWGWGKKNWVLFPSVLFSLGTAQPHNVKGMLCNCTWQSRVSCSKETAHSIIAAEACWAFRLLGNQP